MDFNLSAVEDLTRRTVSEHRWPASLLRSALVPITYAAFRRLPRTRNALFLGFGILFLEHQLREGQFVVPEKLPERLHKFASGLKELQNFLQRMWRAHDFIQQNLANVVEFMEVRSAQYFEEATADFEMPLEYSLLKGLAKANQVGIDIYENDHKHCFSKTNPRLGVVLTADTFDILYTDDELNQDSYHLDLQCFNLGNSSILATPEVPSLQNVFDAALELLRRELKVQLDLRETRRKCEEVFNCLENLLDSPNLVWSSAEMTLLQEKFRKEQRELQQRLLQECECGQEAVYAAKCRKMCETCSINHCRDLVRNTSSCKRCKSVLLEFLVLLDHPSLMEEYLNSAAI